jgi:hypothetical protein
MDRGRKRQRAALLLVMQEREKFTTVIGVGICSRVSVHVGACRGGSCDSAALPDAKGAAARVTAVCCGTVRKLKLK